MMSHSRVAIFSDSSLLCSALDSALQSYFSEVLIGTDLADASHDGDWSKTILVVDATYLQKTLDDLRAFSRRAKPENAVILLRGKQTGTEFLEIARSAGAVLPNSSTIDDIVLTTRLVGRGLAMLPADLLVDLMHQDDDPDGDLEKIALLTDRESGVLALICQGSGNKTIARKLAISDSTVRVHVRSILRKLRLQNRTQAALLAHRHLSRLMRQCGAAKKQ